MTSNSNEHLVVMAKGGPAIKVRTIMRKPEKDRWCSDAIQGICATPREPKHTDKTQTRPNSERDTEGIRIEVEGEGVEMKDTEVQHREYKTRNFRITTDMLIAYGFTEGCPGCDQVMAGKRPFGHTASCRARIEG